MGFIDRLAFTDRLLHPRVFLVGGLVAFVASLVTSLQAGNTDVPLQINALSTGVLAGALVLGAAILRRDEPPRAP